MFYSKKVWLLNYFISLLSVSCKQHPMYFDSLQLLLFSRLTVNRTYLNNILHWIVGKDAVIARFMNVYIRAIYTRKNKTQTVPCKRHSSSEIRRDLAQNSPQHLFWENKKIEIVVYFLSCRCCNHMSLVNLKNTAGFFVTALLGLIDYCIYCHPKVEEFAEYGNLDKASEHHSVERLCRFTVQAASALEYLESKNVVHQLLQLYCMVVSDYQVISELLCLCYRGWLVRLTCRA